jgi:hypothetical protein
MNEQVIRLNAPRCQAPFSRSDFQQRTTYVLRIIVMVFAVLATLASAQELTYTSVRLPA